MLAIVINYWWAEHLICFLNCRWWPKNACLFIFWIKFCCVLFYLSVLCLYCLLGFCSWGGREGHCDDSHGNLHNPKRWRWRAAGCGNSDLHNHVLVWTEHLCCLKGKTYRAILHLTSFAVSQFTGISFLLSSSHRRFLCRLDWRLNCSLNWVSR